MESRQKLIKEDKELQYQEKLWEAKKNILERKSKIKAEKWGIYKKSLKLHISTSKLLILFLFLSCTVIEIFTGYVTVQTLKICKENFAAFDFTPLVTLIGAIVGEVIGYAIYSLKAMKENTVGGVTYAAAIKDMNDNSVG